MPTELALEIVILLQQPVVLLFQALHARQLSARVCNNVANIWVMFCNIVANMSR